MWKRRSRALRSEGESGRRVSLADDGRGDPAVRVSAERREREPATLRACLQVLRNAAGMLLRRELALKRLPRSEMRGWQKPRILSLCIGITLIIACCGPSLASAQLVVAVPIVEERRQDSRSLVSC